MRAGLRIVLGMTWSTLKSLMPRGLYGRAALILLLPIVTLQVVVSVAFIQRHFTDVTRQMTRGVVAEVGLILHELERDPAEAKRIAGALGIALATDVAPEDIPLSHGLALYDLSGRIAADELEKALPPLAALQFTQMRGVSLWLSHADGLVRIEVPRRRVSASNPHQFLVLMVVAGSVMTLIAYFFLRNQLRPITRLGRAAEAFGKGHSVPYRPGGAYEVRAAGKAFLEMRARIERQAQSRMLLLSGVSHDLRTPLTRMRLGLSMIDDPEAEDLRRDVDDMQRMVDAFLDMVRGEAMDAVESVDIEDILEQIAFDVRRIGRDIAVLPPEGEAGPLLVRPMTLRRAIENLVNNALRYGNRAQVSLVYGVKTLRITVEDDGPGIPADQREEVMRPFVRLDPARNQNAGAGVGLGLSIAADAARAHGGSLRLSQSESLGGLRADLIIAR